MNGYSVLQMLSCALKGPAITTVNTPIRHMSFLLFTFSKNVPICIRVGACVPTHIFPSVLRVDRMTTDPCRDMSQQLRYGSFYLLQLLPAFANNVTRF